MEKNNLILYIYNFDFDFQIPNSSLDMGDCFLVFWVL